MHLVIVTSLDALSRNSAASSLAQALPGTPVVLHDLLDDGVVIRRVHKGECLVDQETSVLEHGCLSCTVRLDLAPTLLRLARGGTTRDIVGLPPGTTVQNAIDGLHTVAPRAFTIDTVALAVRPDDVEDQLWDHHTLFESGYTAVPEDGRTPGEFLIGEFLFADTVLAATSNLLPPDPNALVRGIQLISELAPHSRLVPAFTTVSITDLGTYDDAAARSRSLPGAVLAPPQPSPSPPQLLAQDSASHTSTTSPAMFRTFEHRIDRPLHPDRFRTALGAISEGCCFVRGSAWIAGLSDTRIAVHGVGPRIALANGGAWSHEAGQGEWCRGTHIALTGDDLDDADIINLLDACALTDQELRTMPEHHATGAEYQQHPASPREGTS
ncbi:GTP-binding protein [Arthrobacter sp. B0490]|uniref:GTP-binding protein n=1 Tax=Arthrobacter sp. B0490 TaxID=2058891 RepID=UPI000CE52717|nr:GTP-binding protein [Arthrobacter sp. B0490]